jgi:hypothetical protein
MFSLPTCFASLKHIAPEAGECVVDFDDVVITVAAALAVADAEDLQSLCNDGFENAEGSTILGMQPLDLIGLGRVYDSCTNAITAFLRAW